MDVFVDDSSPQITYTSVSGGWISDHRLGTKFYDPMVGSYVDSTFHGTYTEGDQMKFAFNGSGITVFGAKRPNHGVFGVKVDDGDEMFVDTYAATRVYNQRLWALAGLSTPGEHLVTITNYPTKSNVTTSENQWWIDIDYLVITHPVPGSLYTTTIDDTSTAISYGNGWAPHGMSNNVSFNRTDHASTTSNSAMELTFNGSSVQLFSDLGADHGQYSISLDGQPAEAFNATFFETIYQVPVYTVSGLEDTVHTVRMTNLGSGAQSMLGFDYAIVNSSYDHSQDTVSGSTQTTASVSASPNFSNPSTAGAGAASSGSSSNVVAIAGGVAGGAVGLALVLALAWFLFFRRRPTARPPSRADSFYYPSDRSGYASSRGYGPSPYPPSRRGLIDLVADKEARGASGGNSGSDTRSEWSSNGLQTPLTGGIDALPRLERGESQTFLLAVPSPPDSNASSYVIRGAPAAPSTASAYALDGPESTYTSPAAAVAGSSRRPSAVPETTPSEYSQGGTYVSHPPAPLDPQHAHAHSRVDSGAGAGVQDPLLGDARVSWGSRGKDAQRQKLTKLAREQAYVPAGQEHPPLRTPTEPHPEDSPRDSPHIRHHSQPLPHTPPRRPTGPGDTRSLQVTMLSPSGDSDAPLTSSEAAYKAELVKLPYTATPPRPGTGFGLGLGLGRSDSTDALSDLCLSSKGRRMEVPGRAIDMGPLPVHGHGRAGHDEEELEEGTGTLPPDYGAALRERLMQGE